MKNSATIGVHLRTAFSGGLLGVLLMILIPEESLAFQVDSLQQVQTLEALAQSILKFEDYDADGDLDLIIAGTNSSSTPTVKLYKNDGSANFTEDLNSTITGFNYPGLSWGDVDGDGDLDFVISGNTSSGYQAKIYINNGSAVFTESASNPFYDAYWGNMELGDLDNDGDLDVFQTGLQANGIRVAEIFWNDGNGNFTVDTTNNFTGAGDGETPLADVDNDGDLDIMLSGYIDAGGNITQIHLNDGKGNFTFSQSLQGVASNGLDFGDYDNDGDLDLILTGRDYSGGARRAYIYKNDGTGSFSIDATNTIAPVSYSNAKWGDYDHDGDLDLILSGYSDSSIRETYIYTNDGAGTMSYTSNGAITGSEEGYVDWADLDGDGFLEVAITGWDGSARMTKIYQNIRTLPNAVPTAPTNLQATVEGDSISFSWNAGTDADGGPLSYALFYHNSDSSKYLIPAFSDTSNGFRTVNGFRNLGTITSHKIAKTNIPYGNFSWGVQAVDGAGKGSGFSTESVSINPQIPSNLAASRNELQVTLSWSENQTDSVDYYIIYKEDNNSGQVDSLGFSSDTTFSYSGLEYGNTYDFYVATKTTTGFTSDRSDSVEVVVPSLDAPAGLTFARNELSVDLEWNTVQDVAVDYYIIYKEDNKSGQIDSLGFSNDTTFSYSGLSYGNTYDFYVATKTTTGFTSDRSDSVEVVVPSLDAPAGLTITANGLEVELTWNVVQGVSLDYYIVYKEDENSGQIDSLGVSSDTTFSFTSPSYGNTYDFYVATRTTSGFTSDRSDSVEVQYPTLYPPTDLFISGSEGTVELTWEPISEGILLDSYIIYAEENNSGQIDSIGFSENSSFIYSNLIFGNTYNFSVAAKTEEGFISERSDSLEWIVDLFPPEGLTSSINELTVDLTWNEAQNASIDYYIIYKEDNNSGQIDSLGTSNNTTFSYSGLTYGNSYAFSVAARSNAGVLSDRSDSVEISTPNLIAPGSLSYNRTKLELDLTWAANTSVSVSHYVVYKEENNSGQIDSLGLSTDTTFNYAALSAGNTYNFYVATRTTTNFLSDRSDSAEVVVPLSDEYSLIAVDTSGNQKFGPFSMIYAFDFADYDLDGDYDMLAFGYDTTDGVQKIRVLANDGTGNFTPTGVLITNFDQNDPTAISVKWVDSNLDNKPDIFFNGHQSPGSATKIYTNNGDGSFTNTGIDFISSYTDNSYLWMDFDADGDDDVLLFGGIPALENSILPLVYINDGFGNFSVPDSSMFIADYGTGYEYTKIYNPVERIDYDMDRDYDLITNNASQDVAILENKGGLNFVEDTSVPFDDVYANVIEVADVNSDGIPDMVIAGTDGANDKQTTLYLVDSDASGNNYQSGIAKYTGFELPGIDDGDISIFDLNNDGYSEIVLAGDSSGVPITRIYLNGAYQGNGFSLERDITNTQLRNIDRAKISILDLDNDNDLDVFMVGTDEIDSFERVYFLKNNTVSNIPAIDNSLVYSPSASIIRDSLWIGNLPSYNSYNFYLFNQDESKYYIPPKANTTTGFRSILGRPQAEYYNIDYNESELDIYQKYDRNYLPGGNYEVGIQGINNQSGLGSAFKTTTFKVGPMAPRNVVTNVDSANLSVTLTWNQNPGINTSKYLVFKTTDTLFTASAYDLNTYDYSAITAGETTDTTITINNVAANTTNYFYVAAFTNDISISPQYSELSDVDSILITTDTFEELNNSITGVVLGATTWGDYDDDGDLDLVITGTTGNGNVGAIAELWDNDGYGNFSKNTSVSSTLVGAYRSGAAFGDYDNDGFLDLVIIGYNTSNIGTTTLYHNEGDGTFSVVNNTGFENGAWSSAYWGDINNDGYLDLFLSGLPANNIRFNNIYVNDGDGTFTNLTTGIFPTAGGDFVYGDYDNDGDLDLALAGYTNFGNTQTRFYRNDEGTFNEVSAISTLLLSSDHTSLHFVDYDGDGDLDLFNTGGGNARLLVNDGAGNLTNSGPSFSGVYNGDADWSDYDLDGDLDLFYTGNNSGSQSYLYENNGDGTFTENTTLDFTVAETGTVDWVDVDNDGDTDLFVTGNLGTGATSSVLYRNFTTHTNTAPEIPTNLSHTFSANKLSLNWDSASDSEGGPISYSVYLVNDDSTGYLISPESSANNGYRRTIGLGNSGITNSHNFTFPVPPNGNFTWYLQAIDAAGLTSGFASASFTETNTYESPQIPENVTTSLGDLEVTLSWDANTQEYFETFKVYQESDSTVTPSNVVLSSRDTSYTATGLLFETDYHFYITAVDSFGVESALSVRQDVFFEGRYALKDDSTLTGVSYGATAWGDYDNDGDMDVVITGTTNGGNSGAIAELFDNDGVGNFTKNTAISNSLVEAYRSSAAFGDYDNDGFLDLIIIGYNSSATGTTTLYHNNGDGTFSIVSNTGFTNGAWASAAWADYNNDGFLDLLLGGIPPSGPRFNTIYRNNGDGTFSDANAGILGSAGGDFVFADYDNDGDLDVAIAGMTDTGSPQSKFYRNDAGTFNEISAVSITLYANDNATMEWADFDNDGDLDLFNSGNASAQILLNDGNGSLTNSGLSLTGVWDGAADWNDYDLDGDLDLMYTGNYGGPLHNFYQNNGDGTFTKVTTIPFESLTLGTVDFVDIDNDGDADAVNIGFDGGSNKAIIYSNKAENFAASNTPPTIPTALTHSITQNEVTLSWTPSTDAEGGPITYSVYLVNDDSSGFMFSPESDTTNGYRKVIGMGNSELTAAHTYNFPAPPNGNYSWFVQAIDAAGLASVYASASFTETTTYTGPEIPKNLSGELGEFAVTLKWNDVDQEYFKRFNIYQETDSTVTHSNLLASTTDTSYTISGLLYSTDYYFYVTHEDVYEVESSPSNRYDIRFDGNISLRVDSTFTGVHLGATAWGDYDNDGDLDVVITGTTDGLASGAIAELYKNDGTGIFAKDSTVSSSLPGAYRSGAAFGDYDNDGFLDLVIVGYNTSGNGVTTLYHNNGDGTFSSVTNTGFTNGSWASAYWGDMNNDGYSDLFLSTLTNDNNRLNEIYQNEKDGTFTKITTGILGTAGGDFVYADYDNDGDLDVAVSGYTNAGNSQSKFYRKDEFAFTEISAISSLLIASDHTSMDWGDFDNDGDLDLFTTGAGLARLLINDGNGGLTNSGLSFNGVSQGSADWSDYDFDGDLDLFYTGNLNGQNSYLYENNGDGTFTVNPNYGFPKLEQGTVDWVDIDNDGAPELFYTGIESTGDRSTYLFENIVSGSNFTPALPTNLTTSQNEGLVALSWSPATDVEGSSISYNVFVYDVDSSKAITPILADTTTGFRKLIGMGNAGIDTSISLKLNSSTYRWGVQAIDASGKASSFSMATVSITTQSAPDSLFSSVDATSATINWLPPQGSVHFYTVYRINGANADSLGITADTTFTINNLTRDETHYFTVRATSTSGTKSTFSPTISATIAPYYSEYPILSTYAYLDQSVAAVADADNDNDYDIILVGTYNDPYFFENNGNDSLILNSSVDLGTYNRSAIISWADYNNDGYQDVLISARHSNYIYKSTSLYTNTGNNTFSLSDASFEGLVYGMHAWGDYDNDGDLDVLISGTDYTGYYYNYVTKLYENQEGDFVEVAPSGIELNKRFFDAEWADLDNDGDADLVACGYNDTAIYLKNETGTFVKSGQGLDDFYYDCTIALGDYDNDKDLDLFITGADGSYYLPESNLLNNNGSGDFTDSGKSLVAHSYGDAEWGDFDKDGDLDLLSSGFYNEYYGYYSTYIMVNDGEEFSSMFLSINGSAGYNGTAKFVDADNDEDLDILVTGYNGAFYLKNSLNTVTSLPAKPSNIQHRMYSDTLSISWDHSSTATNEPISYDVFVSSVDSGLATPLSSDTTNGVRRIVSDGNAGYNNGFKIVGLPSGSYQIGVQSINGANLSSEFEITAATVVGSYAEFSASHYNIGIDSVLVYHPIIYHPDGDSSFTFSLGSSTNGTVFIDENNNNVVDAGEALTLGDTYYINDIQSDTIKYISNTARFENSPLAFSTIVYPNLSVPSIQTLDQTPEIPGIADQGGWYLISNSMDTPVGTYLENVWTQGAVNADTESGTPNLYTFSQDSAKYIPLTTDLDTTKLAAGTGLLAYLFPDDNYDDAEGPVDGGWPKELANYGNPFGETVQIPVRNVDVDNSNSTTGSEGFALIGNPYSFPVSVDSLIAELKEVDEYANNYVYLWDPINKRYELQIGGSIESYTSFFVRTIQTGKTGDIDLKYSDYFAPIVPKKVPEIEFEFTLAHNATEQESSWKLKISEDALAGIDPYDGFYLGSYSSTFANLYSWVDDQPLVINNLPNQSEELFSIPIYMDASLTGEFSLSWDSESLPEGWTVELEDVESGKVIDIQDQNFFEFNYSNKVKVKPSSPTDFYTFGLTKAKSSTRPVFILKVNTGNAVSSENDLGIPREVELYQNYPNPFNPSSIIRFGVPEQAPVRLEVFDILGRKVMSLLNGEVKQAGRYNITFDGRALASGMYIYRLVIGDKVLTKKMTLIK